MEFRQICILVLQTFSVIDHRSMHYVTWMTQAHIICIESLTVLDIDLCSAGPVYSIYLCISYPRRSIVYSKACSGWLTAKQTQKLLITCLLWLISVVFQFSPQQSVILKPSLYHDVIMLQGLSFLTEFNVKNCNWNGFITKLLSISSTRWQHSVGICSPGTYWVLLWVTVWQLLGVFWGK